MSYRDELKTTATDLGIEFAPNIPTTSLEAEITKAGGTLPENTDETPEKVVSANVASTRPKSKREIISEARTKAFSKKIVTITNKDNREADVVTTAYLAFQNAHFGLARVVPLDMPVELEQCLIDAAKSTNITLHKAEVIKGRVTGNQIPVTAKKYTISYAEQ